MKKLLVFTALLLLMGSAAACNGGGNGSPAPSSPSSSTGENEVILENFSYNPTEITVQVGEEVIWVNQDSATHTVTGNGLDSGDIAGGESYTHTFDTAGTFNYSCRYHPGMRGTVMVTEGGGS